MAPMSRTLSATVEQLIAVASGFWLLAANRLFFDAALQGRPMAEAGTWGFAFALAIGVFGLHFLLLSVLANRWTVKPLLALLIVLTALTAYYMQSFGIYLDPTMIRNVLRTDLAEARELWSWSLLPHLALYAGLPLWLLSRVRVVPRPWPRALAVRAAAIAGAAVAVVLAVMAVFQPLASLMRNHKEMRYLVTPANVLWSTTAALARNARSAAAPREPLGLDAVPLRYSVAVNSVSDLMVNKLDILSGLEELRIATSYRVNGTEARSPLPLAELERAEPMYEVLPGWEEDISGVRDMADLPPNAVDFIDAILAMPGVRLAPLGPEWSKLRQLCIDKQMGGNDLPDAWLAAAVEQLGEHLVSFDRDFKKLLGRARFTLLQA